MDAVTVNIEGLTDVKRALSVLPERIQKNILTAGVRAVASDISKSAKRLVHKDSRDLEKSIIVKKRRSRSKNYVWFTVGINAKKYNVYYGHMVEFGTSTMKEEPFMRPAFEQNKQKAISMMTTKIRSRIDKEIARSRVS